jgi:hypothetical protein
MLDKSNPNYQKNKEYILRGPAEDFWSVLKKEWIDTGQFRI